MKLKNPIKVFKPLKNETILLIKCKVFINGRLVGEGYTMVRQNGRPQPMIYDLEYHKELEPGIYDIRHTDDQYLGIANWNIH